MKKIDLDLEMGRRYKFSKLFRKYGELLLVRMSESDKLYTFRSDDDCFLHYTAKELANMKYKVTPLNNNFDLMWFLLERANLNQNLMPGYQQAYAIYKFTLPVILDSAKALNYYACNVNPSDCCNIARKDCGAQARKVIQKHNL